MVKFQNGHSSVKYVCINHIICIIFRLFSRPVVCANFQGLKENIVFQLAESIKATVHACWREFASPIITVAARGPSRLPLTTPSRVRTRPPILASAPVSLPRLGPHPAQRAPPPRRRVSSQQRKAGASSRGRRSTTQSRPVCRSGRRGKAPATSGRRWWRRSTRPRPSPRPPRWRRPRTRACRGGGGAGAC